MNIYKGYLTTLFLIVITVIVISVPLNMLELFVSD